MVVLLPGFFWAQDVFGQASTVCTVTPGVYNESFNSTTYKNTSQTSAAGWGTGALKLSPKAGGFPSTSVTANLGERVLAVTSGDFNQDGVGDLIVLSNTTTSCHLDYFSNNGTGTFSLSNQIAACTNTLGAVLASGDVDGDGLLDFVFITMTNPGYAGTVATAQLFRNTGLVSGQPTFSVTDISAMLQTANVAWHISGTQAILQDYNGDGRADLLLLSSYNTTDQILVFAALSAPSTAGFNTTPTVLISNVGLSTPIAYSGATSPGGYSCMPSLGTSRGGTVLMPADYNGDGLIDFVAGSVSESTLKLFFQNSDGTFTQQADIGFSPGAPLLGFAKDMNGDGYTDLLVVRSGNDCNGTPGQAWILFNNGTGGFTLYQNQLGVGGSATFGAVFNVDNDVNNTMDVLVGKTTGVGQYIYYKNVAATGVYNLNSTAVSNTIASLNSTTTAVVSVVVSNVSSTVPANTSLTFYVSNTGGQIWEQLTTSELAGAEHTFSSFGSNLLWKAVLTASAATLTGTNAAYTPGATQTPQVTNFAFTYNTVGQQYYTRSALSLGTFTTHGNPTQLLFGAAFQYPGYHAQLFAYNITNLPPGGAPAGTLQQVDNNAAVSLSWEAGSVLQSTSGSSRTLYTSYSPSFSSGNPTTITPGGLLPLNISQFSSPTSTPTLASMMNISTYTVAQQQTILNFLNSGFGDSTNWKLYDVGHSSPVFVGVPSGDANYLGNSYTAFQSSNASRQPIVLIGANDGMLHAFNASTGAELWGFVPYNLLAKFSTQYATNANGVVTYTHNTFVDGQVIVQDIYASGAWHTVAFVAQAQGQGLASNNYYFALDITSTTTPIPLWEFSDRLITPLPSCSLSNNCVSSCTQSCAQNSNSCRSECAAYDSYFNVSSSTPDLGGKPAGCIEAEHFDNETSSTSTPVSDWLITPGPLTDGSGNTPRGNYYVESTPTGTTCTGSTTAAMASCAQMTFRFSVATAGTYYPWLRMYATNSNTLSAYLGIDNAYTQKIAVPVGSLSLWTWIAGNAVTLSTGDHVLNVWMNQPDVIIDAVVIQGTSSTAPLNTFAETCNQLCDQTCSGTCSNTCYSSPSTTAWPQCGSSSSLQCCGASGTDQYCAATGATCPTPPSVMGQTFSSPAIGQVQTTAGGKYVAFFGSGYNNRSWVPNVGRSVYAIDAYTGVLMGQWSFPDVAYGANNPSTIFNTLPGSPTLVDINNDGYVDRLYIGDLEGRLWKINTWQPAAIGGTGMMSSPNTTYPTCILFDAGDPNQTGSRIWAPIITKPAVAILNPNQPNVYFGTGGDDSAPSTNLYQFYSVLDTDALSACRSTPKTQGSLSINNLEWVVGDGLTNTSPQLPLSNPNAEGTVGDRYWADPVISNNATIYFVSLAGKIESVNPCVDLQGVSKVYAYAITSYRDALGNLQTPGQSIFGSPWLQAMSKVRSAVLLRNPPLSSVVHGSAEQVSQAASDVFLQNFSGSGANAAPSIQRLTEQGSFVRSKLRMIRWREVPL